MLSALLFAIAFAAASVALAGVAPMGTAAHAGTMAAHHGHHDHPPAAPVDVECASPLIACSGLGAAPDPVGVASRILRADERSRETAAPVANHEPVLAPPPSKA